MSAWHEPRPFQQHLQPWLPREHLVDIDLDKLDGGVLQIPGLELGCDCLASWLEAVYGPHHVAVKSTTTVWFSASTCSKWSLDVIASTIWLFGKLVGQQKGSVAICSWTVAGK